MTCAIIIEPDDGEEFTIPTGQTSRTVTVEVQTIKGTPVKLFHNGLVHGSPVNGDNEGIAKFNVMLQAGGHSFQAQTGTGDDVKDSNLVNIDVQPASTRPPLVPGQTLRWYLNWLANTFNTATPPQPLYSESVAAAMWAGVSTSYSLLAALNLYLGYPPGSWVSVNAALNTIAGNTGPLLSNAQAAYKIAQNI